MAKEQITASADAGERKLNLPNHRDQGTRNFLQTVHRATVIHRGRRGVDPVTNEPSSEEEPYNRICPVPGCRYPLVKRVKDPANGILGVVPAAWTEPYLEVCLWDPSHHSRTVDPTQE